MDTDVFKALSDSNRLRILEMLVDGELCACKLLEAIDVRQPTLSHHMKILCKCGLVRSRREGQWSYYLIEPDRLNEIIDYLSGLMEGLKSAKP
ncbi:MAG: winged helix-turn-helix transcriptional regulator [Candidatus Methanomethylophilaceae archaeon]|nr:winged helix-turn-helix transcriptional regulator [Candidatus Methanomethylophilaceae archaeon]